MSKSPSRLWSCEKKIRYEREPAHPRLRPYKCKFCQGWHLSSQPAKTVPPPQQSNDVPGMDWNLSDDTKRRLDEIDRNLALAPQERHGDRNG